MSVSPDAGAAGWAPIGKRVVAWGLLGIAVAVTYCWCIRISDDLNWDEAGSLRRYAHHPLTAAAYIHDSNNHPLDSFVRSIVFEVLGLDWPAFWRLAAFLILLGFLAVTWRWYRTLLGAGSIFAASLAVLLLFRSHVIHEQAMVMRGYFPTIVLEAVYFLIVARAARLLDPAAEASPKPSMTPRLRAVLAALCALMMFLLPSNLVLMLVLWPATAFAFDPEACPGGRAAAARLREILKLGLLSGAFTTILYLPILVTLAAGISTIVTSSLPTYPVENRLRAIVEEIGFQFQQIQPGRFVEEFSGGRGRIVSAPGALPDWIFWPALGALLIASLVFSRRARGTRVAWCLILGTLAINVAIAAFNDTPPRIKAPYVACTLFAVVFLAHDLGARWSVRTQIAAAFVAVVLGWATLPATLHATKFDRRGSDLAMFLETYTRPGERRVLVAHANAQTLRPYLHRVFGDGWTMDSEAELAQRLSGKQPKATREIGALERWVTDMISPPQERSLIRPEDVDVLVLIGQKDVRKGAVTWTGPALDSIKARLSRVSRFRHDSRDVEIYEKP